MTNEFDKPQSRNEAALQNILGAENELLEPMSRNEKILHKILGEDIDLEEPQSRIEELLMQVLEQMPSGTISITENGTHDVTQYAEADVNVSGGVDPSQGATATAADISLGKTAAANGEMLTGTLVVPTMPDEYAIGGSLADGTLTGYHFGSNITKIRSYMFFSCNNLSELTIPNGVESIEQSAMSHCSYLTTVYIPDSVMSIDRNTLTACIRLTSVRLPSSLTVISNSLFQQCTGLITLNIPNTVTEFYDYAFDQCASLTTINMPSSLTKINGRVFSGCLALLELSFVGFQSIPTLGNSNSFQNTNANLKIVVPDDLYAQWITETNWVSVASKIVKESDYVGA